MPIHVVSGLMEMIGELWSYLPGPKQDSPRYLTWSYAFVFFLLLTGVVWVIETLITSNSGG